MTPACCDRPMARHGTVTRLLANGNTVEVQRWHCHTCGSTRRVYPEGVGPGRLTATEIALMRRLRARPMSCRAVAGVMAGWGVRVTAVTVWRYTK